MAWNEPGGGKDPWGGNRNNNQGPPDLDELLNKWLGKLGGIGKDGGAKTGGNGPAARALLPIVLLVALVLWGLAGWYQVDEKEQAVVLRLGKFHETVGSGLQWNPPLVDRVTVVRVTEERQYPARGLMLTQDENIVELTLNVQYNISNARDFVLNVRDPEVSLQHATDSALRHVVGGSTLDDVISVGREQVAVSTKERLQEYLNIYGGGINVVKINIEEARPPSAVKAAYDDVIRAREDLERLVNEAQAYSNGIIPEARGQAQRLREESEAYKSQVVSKAEGEAHRFEKLLAEYQKAPEVTRERLYLDALEEVMTNSSKILVDQEGGNNLLYLPLDQLVKQSAAGNPAALNSEGNSQMVDEITNQVIQRLQEAADRSREERRR